MRLLVCACCRLAWGHLPDPRNRAAVEVAERFADGLASEQERSACYRAACEVAPHPCRGVGRGGQTFAHTARDAAADDHAIADTFFIADVAGATA
jgi:hypothetical protein